MVPPLCLFFFLKEGLLRPGGPYGGGDQLRNPMASLPLWGQREGFRCDWVLWKSSYIPNFLFLWSRYSLASNRCTTCCSS